ncbi:hypothetical protein GCM10007036_46000 [Alsobacter metallidurans]|uniref:O-antigen/teichoic acid export membrane protein n=1 Tax=Alsobacter metallidurans TaxID=340221 RepID=A0A917ICY0_9HYPH|nr:polysaccharide biosynthesis C-terminal domain-containing protein [Alsobacter metallidurans]GGH33409.1 hypothetical protein GCM10007036_46000 [Alsobacter metallidurans]
MTRFLISICNSAVNVLLLLAFTRLMPPAWFGELGYARGVAMVAYTLLFDWLRLSVMRYWARDGEGQYRRRDAIRALVGFAIASVAPITGLAVAFGADKVGAAMVVAIGANVALQGYNEVRIAMARAECDDRGLAMLMLPRAGLSLVLAIAAALWGGGPLGVVIMLAVAQCAGLAYLALSGRNTNVSLGRPDLAELGLFFRFGGAIVLSTGAASATALALATLTITHRGPAEYGAFVLVQDLISRAAGVMGLALEMALLPGALAALSVGGLAAARAVLSRNAGLTVAILAPLLLGFWLVAPRFAAVALGAEYRDGFVALSSWVALQCAFTAGQQFVLNQPLFVAERTTPALLCVLAGSAVSLALGFWLIPSYGALGNAWSQLGGAGATFALQAIVVGAVLPAFPPRRAIASVAFSCAAMTAALLPVRMSEAMPGFAGLALVVLAGAAVYAVVLWLLDFEGVRTAKSLRAMARTQAQNS